MRIEVVRENRVCPKEYADFLVRIGGLNPYGAPNFRLVWGGSATNVIWGQMFGGYRGQHVRLKYHGIAAWHFEEWKPAEYWGTPEQWYSETYDYSTGLHTMGDYPFRGDYVCQVKLYERRFEKGQAIVDAFPLSFELIELLVPAMWHAREVTDLECRIYREEQARKEKQEAHQMRKDAYIDGTPAFGGSDFSSSVNRERMLSELRSRRFLVSAEEIKKKMGIGHTQVQI